MKTAQDAATSRPIRSWEFPIVGMLAFVLGALLFQLKMIRVDQRYGDTAELLQLLENIAHHGSPFVQLSSAAIDMVTNGIPTMTAAQIASNPLLPSGPVEVNHLAFHFYAIFYLLAPFVRIFGAEVVLFAMFAASFAGMLLLAYVGLRKCGTPVLVASVFCAAIVLHPAWTQGLEWQFYPDRLFLVLGLAFMIASTLVPTRRPVMIALAILCALIDERAAITAGLFLVAYTVLYWRGVNRSQITDLLIGVALFAYGLLLVKVFLPVNIYNASFMPTSFADLVARFSLPLFGPDVIILMTVNAGFLVLALFDWRSAVIAFFLMVPNIVGSIGGAEKVGWATHYHDEYLPAVVWAGMCGLIALQRLGVARGERSLGALGAMGVALFLLFIDPATGKFALQRAQLSFFTTFPAELAAYDSPAGRATQQWGHDLGAIIPTGVTVTAIEPAMPSLYSGRRIEFYPVDIDHADYAVIVRLPDGRFAGMTSFLGPVEERRINDVLTERMRKDGYDLAHPLYTAPNGIVVLKRVHP
jgi:hypothetical protein